MRSADGRVCPIQVVRDPRVRTIVLLAPATPWYMAAGALVEVNLPILLWTGDRDEHCPPFHAQIVERGVRDARCIERHRVEGDGHFAFQSPFPAAMVSPTFPPSQDPPGFDRAAFQSVLCAEILSVLQRTLRRSIAGPRSRRNSQTAGCYRSGASANWMFTGADSPDKRGAAT